MPVAELLARTSSAELTEWMAYEQIAGPLGGERDDILMAVLAAVIANAGRGKKGRRARPKDFLPTWDRGQRMSWEDMLAAVRQINTALGGADHTEDGGGSDGDPGRASRTPWYRRGRVGGRDAGGG